MFCKHGTYESVVHLLYFLSAFHDIIGKTVYAMQVVNTVVMRLSLVHRITVIPCVADHR